MSFLGHGCARLSFALGFGTFGLALAGPASAAVYSYVDWSVADVANGTASGTITLPDESTVTVTFAAIDADTSPGTLYGAQISGGTNFWAPSTPFISAEVENAPPTPDILQLSGGLAQTYVVTLSEPIKDPVMAIVSLGQAALRTTYDFDAPFTIVSQGAGYWGGSATALAALPDDILEGYEGHGTIRFVGTFDTFSWTVPTPETWHGFTFAIRTTERLEPTPGAGGAGGAGGADGGDGMAGSGSEAGGADGVAGAGAEAGSPSTGAGGDARGLGGEAASAGADGVGVGIGQGGSGGVGPGSSGGAGDSDAGEGDGSERALSNDDGGCGCSVPQGKGFSAGALAALALLLLRRRRG